MMSANRGRYGSNFDIRKILPLLNFTFFRHTLKGIRVLVISGDHISMV